MAGLDVQIMAGLPRYVKQRSRNVISGTSRGWSLKLKRRPSGADPRTVLMAAVVLLGALTVPLLGGRLLALADVPLRAIWALAAALGLQILVISVVPTIPDIAAQVVHLASYALAAAFLWANRRIAGLWLVALGAAANVLVISVNGGVMPASAAALRRAGLVTESAEFENSTVVHGARLRFLGDVFAVPEGWPLANVFSVGDVLIVAGVILTLHAVCASRLGRLVGGGRLPGRTGASATPA